MKAGGRKNNLVLRTTLWLWLGMLLSFGAYSQSTFDEPSPELRSRQKPYAVQEYYGNPQRNPSNPVEALEELLFWRIASESPNETFNEKVRARRSQAKAIGRMRTILESAKKPAVFDQYLDKPEKAIQEAESFFYLQVPLAELIADGVQYGVYSSEEEREIHEHLAFARSKARRIAGEIWSLRIDVLEKGRNLEASLEEEEFEELLNKNKIFSDPKASHGIAELNWVDGVKFIRVKHSELTDSLGFFSIGKHHPRSFHHLKYIAAQHVSAGHDRADGEVGRDFISCWISNENGQEKVDHVRFHPRFPSNPFSWGYRRDNMMYLDADNHDLTKNLKGMVNGTAFGLLQGTLLYLMDKSQVWMNITNAEVRWDLITFAVGFSTFWGYFQPNLKKFTNNPALTNTERTLRRMVSTSLTFNAAAYILTYGDSVFDLTTALGWVFMTKLLVNIWISNGIKTAMEKVIKIDMRMRLNTDEVTINIPGWMVGLTRGFVKVGIHVSPHPRLREFLEKTQPEPGPSEFGLGNKRSDYQMRMVSLKTFTIRLADISNVKIYLPIVDVEVPIGKALLIGLWPYFQYKAVKHAEKRGSDLAPQEREGWEKLKRRASFPFRALAWGWQHSIGRRSKPSPAPQLVPIEYYEALQLEEDAQKSATSSTASDSSSCRTSIAKL